MPEWHIGSASPSFHHRRNRFETYPAAASVSKELRDVCRRRRAARLVRHERVYRAPHGGIGARLIRGETYRGTEGRDHLATDALVCEAPQRHTPARVVAPECAEKRNEAFRDEVVEPGGGWVEADGRRPDPPGMQNDDGCDSVFIARPGEGDDGPDPQVPLLPLRGPDVSDKSLDEPVRRVRPDGL